MIYNINKWRLNSKGTGALIECSAKDDDGAWHNIKLGVQFAVNYSGDDTPRAVCAKGKDGKSLVIECNVFDSFNPAELARTEKEVKAAKAKTARNPEKIAKTKPAKQVRSTKTGKTVEVMNEEDFDAEDDEDIPF